MSGIFGILSLADTPFHEESVFAARNAMTFRGPDGMLSHRAARFVAGAAVLQTRPDRPEKPLIAFDDGQSFLLADARLDDRITLLDRLGVTDSDLRARLCDAELIQRSYERWGDACLEHLRGDFVFVLYDSRHRRLLAARDHFGSKPLYYRQLKGQIAFGNTLDSLLTCGETRPGLHAQTVGDYLALCLNLDCTTTIHEGIRRLPPAHRLILEEDRAPRIERYWTLPIEETLRYRRMTDYVEEFQHLLDQAVADRLQTRQVACLVSGGLDSPSIAATALRLLRQDGAPFAFQGFLLALEPPEPDEERDHAQLVAEHLGFPLHAIYTKNQRLFDRWDSSLLRTPEPLLHQVFPWSTDAYTEVARGYRVLLTGEGGDALLYPTARHLLGLAEKGRFGEMIGDFWRHVRWTKKRPPLHLRTLLRSESSYPREETNVLPAWLDADFARGADLLERLRAYGKTRETRTHPARPEAYQRLADDVTNSVLFETMDPGMTRLPIEQRHPFLDLRLVRFLLRVPPLPWCVNKELLRSAGKGVLPERIRTRPKTPLIGDPVRECLRRPESRWIDEFHADRRLQSYIIRDRIPPLVGPENEANAHDWPIHLRPLALDLWLKNSLSDKP